MNKQQIIFNDIEKETMKQFDGWFSFEIIQHLENVIDKVKNMSKLKAQKLKEIKMFNDQITEFAAKNSTIFPREIIFYFGENNEKTNM